MTVTSWQNGGAVTTALVLAGPERKRIMRELLNRPEPWTAQERRRWAEMVRHEYEQGAVEVIDDAITANLETRIFALRLREGLSPDAALALASKQAVEVMKAPDDSDAVRERKRRRSRKQALVALDAPTLVRHGVVHNCIVCQKPISPRARRDAAYCSAACRQDAYRQRKAGRP